MFRKVHIQLTLLCLSITALIMGLMSVSYLYISERNLKDTYFSSFQNDMNTLLASLESQTVITHKWLSQMEDNGKYLIDILDNGVPFLWGNRESEADRTRRTAIEAGWNYYETHFETVSVQPFLSTWHDEFSFSLSQKRMPDYYGCAAVSERTGGTLSILILEPLDALNAQIRSQRITFAFLVVIACSALGLFSWYFTGKLLSPIEQSRQSQIRFVAAASHELRTPLSVILSASSACRKAQPNQQEKFFDIIREEGESMSRLISDLLLLAGADSQSFSIQPYSCEPDTLLLDTYEAFEVLAHDKGYRLFISLPDEKTAPIRCDYDRIRQVLSILIHNAFCYTPPGSCIRLSLADNAEAISFTVSDNGPGVPDEAKPHIFERFYRADSARNNTDGTHFGLGLSIAAEIVCAHHGRLTVADAPGGGAAFTLTLPR